MALEQQADWREASLLLPRVGAAPSSLDMLVDHGCAAKLTEAHTEESSAVRALTKMGRAARTARQAVGPTFFFNTFLRTGLDAATGTQRQLVSNAGDVKDS